MKRFCMAVLVPLAATLTLGCSGDVETTEKSNTPATSESAENDTAATTEPVATKLDAQTVLSEALASAKAQNKNAFVHIGAPW